MCLPPPRAHLFPYTTLFRSKTLSLSGAALDARSKVTMDVDEWLRTFAVLSLAGVGDVYSSDNAHNLQVYKRDRKSTRLNSSHLVISYAVFCLKKKKTDLHTS